MPHNTTLYAPTQATASVAAVMNARGKEAASELDRRLEASAARHAAELEAAVEIERLAALEARTRAVEEAVAETRASETAFHETKLKVCNGM